MDAETLSQVEVSFKAFHAQFAPAFGRKQCRERSEQYLRALLIQAQERRNAENLSETVNASPRVLQRYLAETTWDDVVVTDRLQEVVAPGLSDPEGVFAVDESGIVKQGRHSAGVARQYCGAVGKVANCQIGVFLAYVSPRGRLIVDKQLYVPREWTEDAERCEEAGIPEAARTYASKSDLALELLHHAKELGYLRSRWVTGDDAYGASPSFRQGVADLGHSYLLEVPSTTPVWPIQVEWETPAYSGRGPHPKPRPIGRREVRERAAALSHDAWQEITIAEGAQGPRTYRFAFERVRLSEEGEPGDEVVWLVHRENLDRSEPRYHVSNTPEATPLATLARVSGARWPIETELCAEKSYAGLDEYETRSYGGWHRHATMCLLANAFLWSLQRKWGEKVSPIDAAAGVSVGARGVAPARMDPRRSPDLARRYPGAQRAGKAVACQASR